MTAEKPQSRKKIAMLGGSFNPPHIGHLFLADEVMRQLGYDKVLFVPARLHPFKGEPVGAGPEDRLAMLKPAVEDNPGFEIEVCELEREETSYTFDTVTLLEQKYRGELEGKIGLIIGDDLAADFDKWYRAEELPDRADIILARRMAGSGNILFPWRHISLDNALLPVSSSDIRERIAGGRSWRYLVSPAVFRYIIQRKLYGYR
ncbi:MAG: nicotinate (nicotinamide) nucleotide adenylyltransferase [Treponema sp.]|jgi:nicotinate-nucleotide adenylyltransferase|nr:nicotinate (nicotinamide) nucleotide adenylyltransferase [Treponema sp.]